MSDTPHIDALNDMDEVLASANEGAPWRCGNEGFPGLRICTRDQPHRVCLLFSQETFDPKSPAARATARAQEHRPTPGFPHRGKGRSEPMNEPYDPEIDGLDPPIY